MQTFLPYSNFALSAAALDNRRLGCQRKEAKQILDILASKKFTCKVCKKQADDKTEEAGCLAPKHIWHVTPWFNHPAVRMWRGYDGILASYGLACCAEWVKRGFNDSLTPYFAAKKEQHKWAIAYPPWLCRNNFHDSHQSMLIKKDRAYYKHQFPLVEEGLPYHWPS